MITYFSQSPVIAIVPFSAQKDRLDTFYYHPLFQDLDDAIEATDKDITNFENACSMITDGTHKTPKYTDKESGVLFLSATNISESGLDLEDCKYISRELHNALSNSQPHPGDVLVAKSGSVGSACVFPEGMSDCSVYESVAIVRPLDGYDPFFLSLLINTDIGVRQILRSQKGIAIKHLHLGDLKEIKFPNFIESKQKEIVNRFNIFKNTLHEIIEQSISIKNQRINLLDSIINRLAIEIKLTSFPKPWFGRLYLQKVDYKIDRLDVLGANQQFENECWNSGKFVPLSEVCDIDGTNEQIPLGLQRYISIDSLPGNYWGDIELPEIEIEKQTGRTHFYPGDIAWAHLKPSILKGKAYIINKECWGSHHFLRLVTSEVEEDLRTIIWAYLKTSPIKRHLANKCTGKSESQKDVSDKALGMLPFPKLDGQKIKNIAQTIKDTIDKSHELEAQENEYKNKANEILRKAKSNIFNLLDDDWFNSLANEAKEVLK